MKTQFLYIALLLFFVTFMTLGYFKDSNPETVKYSIEQNKAETQQKSFGGSNILFASFFSK